ncbi:hypothetical protein [Microbulbifer thermotolerans]|uniref:Peptidase M61 catalytic domain-containing protein n=1 Tax=Microbulbifer thermotolerans TaxID=252514 RepID=A0AB35HU46_MICTH|nr:hypothetical protein [Microbulbifer thermotolerans]MCX2779750.1 hypothetical protein [Microbulbifer thermotolerans]MCX2794907.1 hypothetical protein [Microbulbifer thermotolerans]MCX2800471.1 hypothetical protein [Microbulbifer thermotolerans]MCX2805079.1 hypothetical protein [Microbulbifer thermotolerans]MCX2831095.1 hypothetical protein [Microbulbifer thermotolerans]
MSLRLVVYLLFLLPTGAIADSYSILYRAEFNPDSGMAAVDIHLDGDKLPRELSLNISSGRYSALESESPLELQKNRAIWRPQGTSAKLSYKFTVDNRKGSGSYDSLMTDQWAILRSDKLIPSMAVTGGGHSKAELQLVLPEGWSSELPYEKISTHHYQLKDPGRRFVRPKGWMIIGEIGSRQDTIAGVYTKVAAPKEQKVRRQDTLAFLNWTLPALKEVFPQFPDRLLIVSAGNPMWRGGLSGTRSLFMHADRPLISGNRTSSTIHELVHVATGISAGDDQSDWIVEGLAEFYAVEILRRTNGIGQRRYDEAMDKLAKWGQQAPSLLVKRSSGPITARAVGVMRQLDQEIRAATDGKACIDDIARRLAEKRGKVTLQRLQKLAEEVAGHPVEALNIENLGERNS